MNRVVRNAGDGIQCKITVNKEIRSGFITGEVQINSEKYVAIEQALIEIRGFARCRWKLKKIFPFKNTTVEGLCEFYYSSDTLRSERTSIRHNHEQNNIVQLYQFKLHWPARLPGSWAGDFGYIKYIGKVIVKLHEKEDLYYLHLQEINVAAKRVLSPEKHLLFEGRQDVRQEFVSLKSLGGVNVSVWIPICGIAAGQSLPVLCTIHNSSELIFDGIIFVLTRIDIYRSDRPVKTTKTVRTDVCRVSRMADIRKGKYEYYTVLQTRRDIHPTCQFYKCPCCQITYEVWVSIRGSHKRYRSIGYPNVDTPGIPVIIGTKALSNFDANEITENVVKKFRDFDHPTGSEEDLPDNELVE